MALKQKLSDGIALIGYTLHFGFNEILSMSLNEFIDYSEIAKRINES
ncbi:TPA: hypothetical protein RPW53_000299 [Campylobacter fetus subsp. venerealis]|nr:hypothetical protein [Campylobacter fetus subsp. venerealis]